MYYEKGYYEEISRIVMSLMRDIDYHERKITTRTVKCDYNEETWKLHEAAIKDKKERLDLFQKKLLMIEPIHPDELRVNDRKKREIRRDNYHTLDTPLDTVLPRMPALVNLLKTNRVRTMGDLLGSSQKELMKIDGIKKNVVDELLMTLVNVKSLLPFKKAKKTK